VAADVTLLRSFYLEDDRWRRLGWIVPAVCLGWAAFLWAIGSFLEQRPVPEDRPIDATLVELPAEPAPPAPRRSPPRPPRIREPEPQPAPEPVATPASAPPPPVAATPPAPTPAPAPLAPLAPPQAAARAIYRPLPAIPDNLREQAIDVEALARFDVKADGTVSVVLVKPTPYPDLNRIILETLRTWKFFPAMDAGRPVASSQDVRIKLEVH
jgi:periplasmic protein TonB